MENANDKPPKKIVSPENAQSGLINLIPRVGIPQVILRTCFILNLKIATSFSLRIVDCDFYMCKPKKEFDFIYSSFHGTAIDRVPVVRIFGSTPSGQKTCLHLHKVSFFGSNLIYSSN
jgi:hypothetical protein